MKFRIYIIISISVLLDLNLPIFANANNFPVFPGAEGFGSFTRAMYTEGKDPQICIVTDLTDGNGKLDDSTRNGVPVKTGSFRECFNFLFSSFFPVLLRCFY